MGSGGWSREACGQGRRQWVSREMAAGRGRQWGQQGRWHGRESLRDGWASLGDSMRLEGVGQGLRTAGHILEGRHRASRDRGDPRQWGQQGRRRGQVSLRDRCASLGDSVRLEGVGQGLKTTGHVLEGQCETARGQQGRWHGRVGVLEGWMCMCQRCPWWRGCVLEGRCGLAGVGDGKQGRV